MKKLALFVALTLSSSTWASHPSRLEPRVTAAVRSPYYFAMLPAQYEYKDGQYEEIQSARGIAYRLQEDGGSVKLWEVEGWYANTVYLSADGRHLIRIGNWPEGFEPDSDDLAVAFYHEGELLREYSTADLINNPRNVRVNAGHYFWLARDGKYPRLSFSNHFMLKTIENRVLEFDISTGDIIGSIASPQGTATMSHDTETAPRNLDETTQLLGIRRDGPASFTNIGLTPATPSAPPATQ